MSRSGKSLDPVNDAYINPDHIDVRAFKVLDQEMKEKIITLMEAFYAEEKLSLQKMQLDIDFSISDPTFRARQLKYNFNKGSERIDASAAIHDMIGWQNDIYYWVAIQRGMWIEAREPGVITANGDMFIVVPTASSYRDFPELSAMIEKWEPPETLREVTKAEVLQSGQTNLPEGFPHWPVCKKEFVEDAKREVFKPG